jgi:glutathione S-transferase
VITLYQAEWCPFSSAVRERLTELGVDFVAKQVAPDPERRGEIDEIPTLVTDDDERFTGTRAIFGYLATLAPWEHERRHRERYAEHAEERRDEVPGRVLGKAAPL